MKELIHRDPKGIYKKALKGQLKNVMGMDLKVEFPLKPDIEITWVTKKKAEDTFKEIVKKINVKPK